MNIPTFVSEETARVASLVSGKGPWEALAALGTYQKDVVQAAEQGTDSEAERIILDCYAAGILASAQILSLSLTPKEQDHARD